jgi:hypothetical protein
MLRPSPRSRDHQYWRWKQGFNSKRRPGHRRPRSLMAESGGNPTRAQRHTRRTTRTGCGRSTYYGNMLASRRKQFGISSNDELVRPGNVNAKAAFTIYKNAGLDTVQGLVHLQERRSTRSTCRTPTPSRCHNVAAVPATRRPRLLATVRGTQPPTPSLGGRQRSVGSLFKVRTLAASLTRSCFSSPLLLLVLDGGLGTAARKAAKAKPVGKVLPMTTLGWLAILVGLLIMRQVSRGRVMNLGEGPVRRLHRHRRQATATPLVPILSRTGDASLPTQPTKPPTPSPAAASRASRSTGVASGLGANYPTRSGAAIWSRGCVVIVGSAAKGYRWTASAARTTTTALA